MSANVAVDFNGSYLLAYSFGYHLVVVGLMLILLITPGTIGEDEVEKDTVSKFFVVLKASELVKHSNCKHIIYLSSSWLFKHLGAFRVRACYLCQPDIA